MSSDFEPEKRPDDPNPTPPGGPYSQQVQHQSVSARVPEGVGRGVLTTAVMVFHTNQEFVIDFLATMVRPPQVVARMVMSPVTFSQLIRGLRTNVEKYEQQFGPLSSREPAKRPPAAGAAEGAQPGTPAEGPSAEDAPAADASADGVPPGMATGAVSPPSPEVAGVVDTAGGMAGVSAGGMSQPPIEPGRPVDPQPNRIEDIYDQLKLPDEKLGGVYTNVAMIRHTGEEFCFDFIANFYPRSVVTARVYMSAGRIPSLIATMTDSFEQFRRKTAGGGGGPQGGSY
jgi:hypothetical protein